MSVDFSFSENTIGYIVEGVMDKKAVLELRDSVLHKLKTYDKVNLYLEDNEIRKFTLTAVFIATIFPIEYSSKLNKIAIVSNRKWIHALATIDDFFIQGEFKKFPTENRLDAMAWIAE
ncbi:STAS/SEC14 domain-containing protein [Ulvibacter litoralis]|uniref:SpoIIAA-like n=1 Tax=Ulvibacter litoralis TaxID=227084 RepID=A0A1G7CAV2_9FLAO|nr:STAS/SEC14 domain-containing protein [Ulvibacter litoralis]GHC47998.1 hypothetical protein GCM10008083_09090 [Ulvibacter litoralis]SDE36494.1 SpoIIAA-like [Ulvibacter litoralis]